MPGVGGVGAGYSVNETVGSSNIISSAGALALSLASAFGTVELNKYAQSQGSFLVATGDPSNPVSAIPGSQIALQQQQLQLTQQRQTSVIVLGVGALLLALVILAAVKK